MGNKYRDPQSPNEAIMQNILGEENELREPRSVTEFYLQEILKQGGGGADIPTPTAEDNGKMLGVDNGAYALVEGGGKKLYAHYIRCGQGINTVIVNDDSTAFTSASLGAFLLELNATNGQRCIPTTSIISVDSDGKLKIQHGLMTNASGSAVSTVNTRIKIENGVFVDDFGGTVNVAVTADIVVEL